jgi:hypothetical protein
MFELNVRKSTKAGNVIAYKAVDDALAIKQKMLIGLTEYSAG